MVIVHFHFSMDMEEKILTFSMVLKSDLLSTLIYNIPMNIRYFACRLPIRTAITASSVEFMAEKQLKFKNETNFYHIIYSYMYRNLHFFFFHVNTNTSII
jgi:hypothetical protein